MLACFEQGVCGLIRGEYAFPGPFGSGTMAMRFGGNITVKRDVPSRSAIAKAFSEPGNMLF
jgi:hypothetical protein